MIIEEIGYYTPKVKVTLDGEWTAEELVEEVHDLAFEILPGWLEKNKYRAVKNKDLLHDEFLRNEVLDNIDVIDIYNEAVSKHRNDKEKLFGIVYFDEAITKMLLNVLDDNLFTK